MPQLYTAALAQVIIREHGTLNVSLINLVSDIQVAALPVPGVIFRCFAAFELSAADNQVLRVRAIPVDPNGNDQVDAAAEPDTQAAGSRHQWFLQMPRWVINLAGLWRIRFDVFEAGAWRPEGSVPVSVNLVPTAAPT